MKRKLVSTLLLLVLVLGALTPATQAQARAEATDPSSKGISPREMLNADGTLALTGNFNGALDLSGYNIQLDPERGPVFGAASSAENSPAPTSLAAPGNWVSLGSGAGALNNTVNAIAVIGTDVYVGGIFTDVANISAADYIAKWNGSQWSSLGDSGYGNNSLVGGSVGSLTVSGTDLYVGGSFTAVYNHTGSVSGGGAIAKWNTLTSTWSALGSNGAGGSALTGSITSIAVDGSGNVYAGGSFTNVNNNGAVLGAADYVAKFDGTNWSALGSNGAGDGSLNGWVNALGVDGSGNVYVGGTFTDVNNNGTILTAADKVAKFDALTGNWSALSSNGASDGSISSNSTVYAIAVSGTNVYVGGNFAFVNNSGAINWQANYVARWDTAAGTWSALGNSSLGGQVRTILLNGTDIYVAGYIQDVHNNGATISSADYVAKFDGTNWSALGSNGAGNGAIPIAGFNGIYALAMQGTHLLVGGTFYDVNNGGTVLPSADYLAQWDGSNWSALSADVNGSVPANVYAVAVSGTNIYVGGGFANVANHGINIPEADYIVKWDGSNWSALGSNGNGNGALTNSVTAIAVDASGNVYAGGNFTNITDNGTSLPAADYIAKFDGTHWTALGSNGAGNGSLNSQVKSIAVDGAGNIYAGGTFTNVNDNGAPLPAADYIAKWNGTDWSALGNDGAGNGSLNAQVSTIVVSATNLYVGGYFTNVNDNGAPLPAADYIAKWNGTDWSALGSDGAGNGSLNNVVFSIAVNGTQVYVGGTFSNVNDNGAPLPAADEIAKWDGTDWSALGDNGAGNGVIGYPVESIAVNGTDVYVGGRFPFATPNLVADNSLGYIAKWDGTVWSGLGGNGAGGSSLNDDPGYNTLAILGNDLIVGGSFTNVNNKGTVMYDADFIAAYGIGSDVTPPSVQAIQRASANPTNAASVDFSVDFSEPVNGVDPADFTLTSSGVSSPAVSGVSGSGSVYTVTVNTGTGDGTIRLDVTDNDSILDLASNPLGGADKGNGNFTTGEIYTITKNSTPTNLLLSNSSVTENLPADTLVGTFSTTDSDIDNIFIYSLVSGTGSDDNAHFSIVGNTLKTAHPFNYLSRNSYSIRVRTTDNSGAYFEKAFTISILNAAPILSDVPDSYWAVSFIERLYNARITGGCVTTPLQYCPDSSVTRAQMAVFLEKGLHGSGFTPPAATGTKFSDVPTSYWAAAWIEALAADGITGGCGNGNYCPDAEVTRAQMAIFLLKAGHGFGYTPSTATGTKFADVPVSYWAAAWIEQLAAEGVTGGCGNGNYCPDNSVTRAQMAVFLVKAFSLP